MRRKFLLHFNKSECSLDEKIGFSYLGAHVCELLTQTR